MKPVIFTLILLLLLSLCACACGESDFYTEMPPFLRFTQETVREEAARDVYIRRTYPDTANDDVDAQLRRLIDEMAERNRNRLPLVKGEIPSYLDVGAAISRTGTSILSFLVLGEVSKDMEQLSVDYLTRVYDIETGRLLTLNDFFDDGSGAWSVLRDAVQTQLSAAFPALSPDPDALDRLVSAENLKNAAFTLGAARLTLTYRADTLYPGKNTLLHVHVYYPEIRDMMTDFGKSQTDNSRFRMLALTFDDGCARGHTRAVIDALRRHGAQATFFIVGRTIARNHDILALQQDSGYSIQSHSYTHTYPDALNPEEAYKEEARLKQELGDVIGVVPTMMRAPGGNDGYYVHLQIGYPIINWSAPSGDSGNDNVKGIISVLKGRAEDGAVVLMHDLRPQCHVYTEAVLEYLDEQGYLCVTVEELFCDAGVALKPNTIYYSPYRMEE